MKENSIEKLQERLETLYIILVRLVCRADDLDIREEIAKVEKEIKELEDDINEKNSKVTDTNVGDIEEAVKTMEHWIEYEKNNKDKINKADELIYIQEIILSDYKRVLEINEVLLKENEMHKRNSEIMSKENLSTAEQLKVEIKENFRLKNQLENNRKEYQETYKDVREELKELKKENEELENKIMKKELEIIGKEEYTKASMGEIIEQYYTANEDCVSKSKIEDIIDRIDYDIKKTKAIISNDRRNNYQRVRLKAMNTKSLDIKKRLQKLLESEE